MKISTIICLYCGVSSSIHILFVYFKGYNLNPYKYLLSCAFLSIVFYAGAAVIPFSFAAIVACGLCGFTAGIMWPATLSLASEHYPTGGAAMFGLFALAGDIGCTLGPTAVGVISASAGDNLRVGLLVACIFPILSAIGLSMLMKRMKKLNKANV